MTEKFQAIQGLTKISYSYRKTIVYTSGNQVKTVTELTCGELLQLGCGTSSSPQIFLKKSLSSRQFWRSLMNFDVQQRPRMIFLLPLDALVSGALCDSLLMMSLIAFTPSSLNNCKELSIFVTGSSCIEYPFWKYQHFFCISYSLLHNSCLFTCSQVLDSKLPNQFV